MTLIASFPVGCVATTDASRCAGFSVIRPTEQEVTAMSSATKRRVIANNLLGEEQGCWKP